MAACQDRWARWVLRRVDDDSPLRAVKSEHDMIGLGSTKDLTAGSHTQHPEAQWFGDAGLGLFLHWGISSVKAMNIFAEPKERHALLNALRRSGIVRLFQAQFHRRDGTIIWAEVNMRMIWNDSGNLGFYEGSLEDITTRKEAERSLLEGGTREDRQRLSVIALDLELHRRDELVDRRRSAAATFVGRHPKL